MIRGELVRLFVVHHKVFERLADINCGEIDLDNANRTAINEYLNCLSKLYEIEVDNQQITGLKWQIYEHPTTQEIGLITGIPLKNLPIGEHQIQVKIKLVQTKRHLLNRYGLEDDTFVNIPF